MVVGTEVWGVLNYFAVGRAKRLAVASDARKKNSRW